MAWDVIEGLEMGGGRLDGDGEELRARVGKVSMADCKEREFSISIPMAEEGFLSRILYNKGHPVREE